MADLKPFLSDVKSHPQWPILLEEARRELPGIPRFTPGADAGAVDEWKYTSGVRDGYLHALTALFHVKPSEVENG